MWGGEFSVALRSALVRMRISTTQARYARLFGPSSSIDSIVSFRLSLLSHEVIQQITIKELNDLRNREGLECYGRGIEWTTEVVDHLARTGFQNHLGARPLQLAIETDIVAPLAKWIVEHNVLPATTLQLDWDTHHQLLIVHPR